MCLKELAVQVSRVSSKLFPFMIIKKSRFSAFQENSGWKVDIKAFRCFDIYFEVTGISCFGYLQKIITKMKKEEAFCTRMRNMYEVNEKEQKRCDGNSGRNIGRSLYGRRYYGVSYR